MIKMYDSLLNTVIQLIIAIISFCVGKYLLPKLPQETAATIRDKMKLIITYADQYVNWADRFMEGSSGSEKLSSVVGQLKEVASKYGFQATDQELTAIAQTAFENMSLQWDTIENGNKEIASAVVSTLRNTWPEASPGCMVPSAMPMPVHDDNSVDQETIDDANKALQDALIALENAKVTITQLKASQVEPAHIPEQPIVSPKEAMREKIDNLRVVTREVNEIIEPPSKPIESERSEEVEYEDEPNYDETELEDEDYVPPPSPSITEIPRTPTRLKDLAIAQSQKGTQAVKNMRQRLPQPDPDDLSLYMVSR